MPKNTIWKYPFKSLLTIYLLGISSIFSQQLRPNACGTDVSHQIRYENDREYRQSFDQLNDDIYRIISHQMREDRADAPNRNGNCSQVVSIPVVVHIMHLPADATPDDNSSNITDARVQAGIDHLNDAFRNRNNYAGGPFYTNAGVQSVDVEIEFVLARRSPNGSATSGILRTPTNLSNLFKNDPCGAGTEDGCLKDLSRWDPTQYMNVWLVNEICETSSNNPGSCWLAGYAFYANSHGKDYDGLVNEVRYWGASEDESKLHIHEVGHYLNLFHTFRGEDCANNNCLVDGDRVCDTPPDMNGAIFTSCNSPNPDFRSANSCASDVDDTSPNNPFSSDVEDMYENYMDYGYWVCQNTFTQGQKDRMRAALFGIRASLLASEGSIPPNSALDAGIESISFPGDFVCEASFTPVISVVNYGLNPLTSLSITEEIDGVLESTANWTGNLPPGERISITLNTIPSSFEGSHTLKVSIADANGIGKDSYDTNDQACTNYSYTPSTHISILPYCLDFESSPALDNGWSRQNPFRQSLWKPYTNPTNCGDNGSAAYYLDSWSNAEIELASTDAIVSTVIDLSGYTSADLSFDWAYIRSFAPLGLKVEVSTDCGNSFSTLSSKNDIELATASGFAYGSLWVPSDCSEWASEDISLNAYLGGKIILRFDIEYTASASFSQRIYLDNICIDGFTDVILPCSPLAQIPTSAEVYVADQSCVDAQGWTHYWKAANTAPLTATDVLLLSIQQDASMQLFPNQVKLELTQGYGNAGHDLSSAPYVSNSDGWYVMGRYFDVNPSVQPATAVNVRFYYDNTDFQDVQNAIASSPAAGFMSMHSDLVFYKIDNEDPNPSIDQHANISANNFRELRHDSTPSLSQWTYTPYGNHHQAEFMVASFSGGGGGSSGSGTGSGPFPVELLGFIGKSRDYEIELTWSTASELNNDKFVLEKVYSEKEKNTFVAIGEIEGQGTTNELQHYAFNDKKPKIGSNIYRLKQIDFDGQFTYSASIEVMFKRGLALLVYPNPSGAKFTFQFEDNPAAEASIKMYNLAGQLVMEDFWAAQKHDLYELDLTDFSAGVYFYHIQIGNKINRGKLMKE